VLEEFMLEAGATTEGRDLRLESTVFGRDRHGDVVWLDFMALHRHLVVDVTVTSARTNTSVPRIVARLQLPGSFALGTKHGKLDAYLCTSALLIGTPSALSVHDYYPSIWRMGADWRPWRLSWLIA
jgi:hypothetical protein